MRGHVTDLRILGAALAAAALFAGCGSDSKAPASRQTSSDRGLAHSALLRIADFPVGWTASDNPAGDTFASSCPEVQAARKATTARATEPNFAHPPNTVVESLVYAFADAAGARRALRGLGSEATRNCVAEDFVGRARALANIRVGNPAVRALRIPPVGAGRAGFRAELPISSGSTRIVLVQDVTFIRSGRALAIVAIAQQREPLTHALRDNLLAAAAMRLHRAFGR